MQIDNSGSTYVFDAKTQEAIEEGKNRLTLIDAETVRLARLKKTLEGEVVKLEADITYKEGRVEDLNETLILLEGKVEEAEARETRAHNTASAIDKEIDKRKEAVAEREEEARLTFEAAKRLETENMTGKKYLEAEMAIFEAAKAEFEKKRQKLEDVIKEL